MNCGGDITKCVVSSRRGVLVDQVRGGLLHAPSPQDGRDPRRLQDQATSSS
jgi:hypothetical protein